MRNDFAVFILCYGRPDKCDTIETLHRTGYTGKYYLICSKDDPTAEGYYKTYGDKVIFFDKDEIEFDRMDNFGNNKCVVYARNVCFEIAKALGVHYFLELDDDYYELDFRFIDTEPNGKKHLRQITNPPNSADELFDIMLELLDSSPRIKSVALAQNGDFLGGAECSILSKNAKDGRIRKCMNSFFCDVNKPIQFKGTFNEDVNLYTLEQSRGDVFLTVQFASINQRETQLSDGGMVKIYEKFGTYVKSFYSVMCMPSAVSIGVIGNDHFRVHHNVAWNNTVPKIISQKYKKTGGKKNAVED